MKRRFELRIRPTAPMRRRIAVSRAGSICCAESWSHFPPEHFAFDIRPELGSQIAGQIEPECHRTMDESLARRIETVRIPHVGKKGCAVVAAETPGGQCLAACVGSREDGSPNRMRRPAPESRAARSIVTRVLVQRGIQAECESAVYPRPAYRGGEALAVGGGALPPLFRRVKFLESCSVCGEAHDGQRAVGLFGVKLQLGFPIERIGGLRNPCNRNRHKEREYQSCHDLTAWSKRRQ